MPPTAAAFPAAAGATHSESCPLIAARATDDELDPLESLGEIVAVAQRELGDALREVSGPAVIATFEEIKAGVQEDIDTDAEASRAGASGAAGHEPVYQRLLGKVEAIQKQQRIERGLRELAIVGSEEQLREVVARWPELMTEYAERLMAEIVAKRAPTEDRRRFASSMLQTVQLSRQGDFAGAWSVRESVIRKFQEETVAPRLRAFEDAKRGATRHAIAQAGMELLDVLPPGTHPELQVEVAATAAAALLEDDGADYDQNVESAIALGELAISILNSHPDLDHPHRHVPILMNLGTAFGLRPRGDPAWNRTQSITHLTNAIDLSWQAGNRDSWAMGLTPAQGDGLGLAAPLTPTEFDLLAALSLEAGRCPTDRLLRRV